MVCLWQTGQRPPNAQSAQGKATCKSYIARLLFLSNVPYVMVSSVQALVKNYGIKARKAYQRIDNPAYPRTGTAKDGRDKVKLKKPY